MKKAFTMAEAIIVMTILGIIATIIITNIKPTEFRDRSLQVLAKKILREIDEATNQILINNTQNGTLDTIYHPDNNSIGEYNGTILRTLYKKYLQTSRREVPSTFLITYWAGDKTFRIKDGACMSATSSAGASAPRDSIFPEETTVINIVSTHGWIYYDVNCEDEPNILGKDQFVIPLDKYGIKYD